MLSGPFVAAIFAFFAGGVFVFNGLFVTSASPEGRFFGGLTSEEVTPFVAGFFPFFAFDEYRDSMIGFRTDIAKATSDHSKGGEQGRKLRYAVVGGQMGAGYRSPIEQLDGEDSFGGAQPHGREGFLFANLEVMEAEGPIGREASLIAVEIGKQVVRQ